MAEFGLPQVEFSSLLGHLDELRRRLIWIAVFLAASTVAAYFYAPRLLLQMAGSTLKQMVFLSPSEAFFAQIKIAVAVGAIITLPMALWHLWRFISPSLNRRQRRLGFLLVPISFLLFVGGVTFAYFLIIPAAMRFFLTFAGDNLEAMITVNNYISFVLGLALPFGLVFELPVLVLFLAWLGIIRPEALAKKRRYAILGIFVLAAVLTPTPDIFTQTMMALPMIVLFEISILIARLVWRKKRKAAVGG
ncbi:MAG: twin-arginine translocase subunit TatC [Firmicutes bacterium]|nr:twin-arginine translocase subunit TatC [Bacillota bacterium]